MTNNTNNNTTDNSRKMTTEKREANKAFAAACNGCGGWTSFGGMSHFSTGINGCDCHTSK